MPKTVLENAQPVKSDDFYRENFAGRCGKYYRLHLSGSAKVSITLLMHMDNGTFSIWNQDYEKLNSDPAVYDRRFGCLFYKKTMYFRAGIYYFKIAGTKGSYTFRVRSEPVKESFPETPEKNNDCRRQADPISLDTDYLGLVGYDDPQDFYEFYLPFSGRLSVLCQSQGKARLRCCLLDSGGRELAGVYSCIKYGDDPQEFFPLKKGTYYLKICGDWEMQHGPYYFKITAQ